MIRPARPPRSSSSWRASTFRASSTRTSRPARPATARSVLLPKLAGIVEELVACPRRRLPLDCRPALRGRTACERRGAVDASGCKAREGQGQGGASFLPQVSEDRNLQDPPAREAPGGGPRAAEGDKRDPAGDQQLADGPAIGAGHRGGASGTPLQRQRCLGLSY